ncbi:MAG: SAM-dependent methyltransferase [Clostridia bacterium]|nr:SAM-dependent methyltransferase [Clostridia bacterium]
MRLNEIFVLIDNVSVFADVGCDHGQLCKMVYDSGKANRILALDISDACLSKAKALLGDKAEYYLGDGLKPLGQIVPDLTVISGMGGSTILHIVGQRILPCLIVSPHNDAYKVRATLCDNGYKIIEDKVVIDNGKFYDIIKLVPGKQELTELQKTFGAFYERGDEVFCKRLTKEKAKLLTFKQTESNVKKLALIAEVEKCLK